MACVLILSNGFIYFFINFKPKKFHTAAKIILAVTVVGEQTTFAEFL